MAGKDSTIAIVSVNSTDNTQAAQHKTRSTISVDQSRISNKIVRLNCWLCEITGLDLQQEIEKNCNMSIASIETQTKQHKIRERTRHDRNKRRPSSDQCRNHLSAAQGIQPRTIRFNHKQSNSNQALIKQDGELTRQRSGRCWWFSRRG